jgi:DNA-binding transcriptional MerR regulator
MSRRPIRVRPLKSHRTETTFVHAGIRLRVVVGDDGIEINSSEPYQADPNTPKLRIPGVPPGIQRTVNAGWNTRDQVAKKVGRSVSTIKNWEREGRIKPEHSQQSGKLRVWLYSDNYVEQTIRPLTKLLRPGPKPRPKPAPMFRPLPRKPILPSPVVPSGNRPLFRWNTRSQVARKIGRTIDTIKKWETLGLIEPEKVEPSGNGSVTLYSDEYVESTIRPLAERRRGGPKARAGTIRGERSA